MDGSSDHTDETEATAAADEPNQAQVLAAELDAFGSWEKGAIALVHIVKSGITSKSMETTMMTSFLEVSAAEVFFYFFLYFCYFINF